MQRTVTAVAMAMITIGLGGCGGSASPKPVTASTPAATVPASVNPVGGGSQFVTQAQAICAANISSVEKIEQRFELSQKTEAKAFAAGLAVVDSETEMVTKLGALHPPASIAPTWTTFLTAVRQAHDLEAKGLREAKAHQNAASRADAKRGSTIAENATDRAKEQLGTTAQQISACF